MSKSKNNGVDPQDLIERYGADTARSTPCSPRRPRPRWSGTTPAWRAATASCAGCGLRSRPELGKAQWPRRRAGRGRAQLGAQGMRGGDPPPCSNRSRLPAHAVQHRGLGRDEDAQRAGGLQGGRHAARPAWPRGPSASCCAACIPATPHHGPGGLDQAAACRAASATCSTRTWPAGRRRAGAGRDRAGAAGQRQAARAIACRPRTREGHQAAAVARAFPPILPTGIPRKVVVVPGRLVNVVV